MNFNPLPTTSGQGLFTSKSSTGLVQGTAYPDPATRFALRQVVLASDETLPAWGGIGIYEDIPGAANGPSSALGPVSGRANSLTGSKRLAGFSVFDQAYNGINTPQSPVPTFLPGMSLMSYRLGSGARIALACDPQLVDLMGEPIGSSVVWDFVNSKLVPYTGAETIASGTYDPDTGIAELVITSGVDFEEGVAVTISSASGTGSFAALNGVHTTLEGTTGDTVLVQLAEGLTMTITGGSLTTGAALSNVSVLDVQPDGCMTVEYDATTGFATWNYDGACAIVQI